MTTRRNVLTGAAAASAAVALPAVTLENACRGDDALLRLWDVYLIASREQRKAMADPKAYDDDDLMHGLCARLWNLRDQIAAMPTMTPAGWSCKLKLALLELVTLPELEFNAESFGGPPPDRIADPEYIEEQGIPWSKYPPAKPGALWSWPLKAAGRVADAARRIRAA